MKPIPMLEPMTSREIEIVEYLLAGKCNKEIAKSLQRSVSCIKQNVSSVLKKMGVETRTQAVTLTNLVRSIVNKE